MTRKFLVVSTPDKTAPDKCETVYTGCDYSAAVDALQKAGGELVEMFDVANPSRRKFGEPKAAPAKPSRATKKAAKTSDEDE